MAAPDLSLLARRRFGPMFLVQFLGAFNDNLLKFAMLFMVNFGIYAARPGDAKMLAAVATGLFVLPYFLFSAFAGQLADKIDKARLVRWVKGAEIAIMGVALAGFAIQSIALLMASLFLMGFQSAIFGPVKYSILPQHLRQNEIMGGTGLIEAGTFLAILGGQLLAGVISPQTAGMVAMGLSALGLLAAWAVPPAPPVGTGHRLDWNIWQGTKDMIGAARHGRGVWLAILGISWFFACGRCWCPNSHRLSAVRWPPRRMWRGCFW